jgi:hypothetical protein
MVRNIGRELTEIEQDIERRQGNLVAEPRLTDTWMAHRLISSKSAAKGGAPCCWSGPGERSGYKPHSARASTAAGEKIETPHAKPSTKTGFLPATDQGG